MDNATRARDAMVRCDSEAKLGRKASALFYANVAYANAKLAAHVARLRTPQPLRSFEQTVRDAEETK